MLGRSERYTRSDKIMGYSYIISSLFVSGLVVQIYFIKAFGRYQEAVQALAKETSMFVYGECYNYKLPIYLPTRYEFTYL